MVQNVRDNSSKIKAEDGPLELVTKGIVPHYGTTFSRLHIVEGREVRNWRQTFSTPGKGTDVFWLHHVFRFLVSKYGHYTSGQPKNPKN